MTSPARSEFYSRKIARIFTRSSRQDLEGIPCARVLVETNEPSLHLQWTFLSKQESRKILYQFSTRGINSFREFFGNFRPGSIEPEEFIHFDPSVSFLFVELWKQLFEMKGVISYTLIFLIKSHGFFFSFRGRNEYKFFDLKFYRQLNNVSTFSRGKIGVVYRDFEITTG